VSGIVRRFKKDQYIFRGSREHWFIL